MMIEGGTIACIRLCQRRKPHRHDLVPIYGPMMRMREEPTFAEVVAGLCDLYGLRYCHVPDARKALVSPGWPDFEIWGRKQRMYVELKGYRGIVTVEQRRLGNQLLDLGETWAVWHTRDLYAGDVETALLQLAGGRS